MLVYFKKYIIVVCVVAAAVPIAVSTAWPLVFGGLMMATIQGTLLGLVLFFVTMSAMIRVMGRKADGETRSWIARYNDACDPQAFVEQARQTVALMTPPYDAPASWFLSYYAQAQLDCGRPEEARRIAAQMAESVEGLRKPLDRSVVAMNAVPLVMKLDGPEQAASAIERAYVLLGVCNDAGAAQRRAFLDNQNIIARGRLGADEGALRELYERTIDADDLPLRVRVEYAFDDARLAFREADSARERERLAFVVERGGSLALVAPARRRLEELGSAFARRVADAENFTN